MDPQSQVQNQSAKLLIDPKILKQSEEMDPSEKVQFSERVLDDLQSALKLFWAMFAAL